MGCWSPDTGTKRGCIKGNVHIKIAILYVLNLDGVISNIDRVNPGVLEHLAAEREFGGSLFLLMMPLGSSRFEEVGVGNGVIIHLEGRKEADSGKCHPLRHLIAGLG